MPDLENVQGLNMLHQLFDIHTDERNLQQLWNKSQGKSYLQNCNKMNCKQINTHRLGQSQEAAITSACRRNVNHLESWPSKQLKNQVTSKWITVPMCVYFLNNQDQQQKTIEFHILTGYLRANHQEWIKGISPHQQIKKLWSQKVM